MHSQKLNDPHTVLYYVEGQEHEDVLGSADIAIQHARGYQARGYMQVRIIRQLTQELVPFEVREEA